MESNDYQKNLLILGGAGFIGSNIVFRYLREHYNITVIDGLLEHTSGSLLNLKNVLADIRFIKSRVEEVAELETLVRQSSLIIDSMAWTSHISAIKNPQYDLALNCQSHLCLIESLRKHPDKVVLYLGSRGQYGNPQVATIAEETPMIPEDVQGIHKLAAESYFRVYSNLDGFAVGSLRIPNCFGQNQPVLGDDIGLVGSFVRAALLDEEIFVYGSGRKRSLIFVDDLVEMIYKLGKQPLRGFQGFNTSCFEISILELAQTIIDVAGRGKLKVKELPKEVATIDIGGSAIKSAKLEATIQSVVQTDFKLAIAKTIKYFKETMK